jgi:phasin family protein
MKTSTRSAKSRKISATKAGPDTVKLAVGASVASKILRSRRKDADVLALAGLKSYEGIQAVVQRHRQILRQSLSELKAVGKMMRSVGARESIAHLDDLGRGAVNLTLASIRELASLATATQNQAFKLLEQRLREDIADLKRLRRAKTAPHAKKTPD